MIQPEFPLIISFFTLKTLYQLEVQNLIESCKKWGLDYSVEGVDSLGSWELNCAYKPYFIYNALLHFKRPVLWVDADGAFVRSPSLIPAFEADLATRINDDCSDDHPSKVISSTIFVNYSEKGLGLVRLWAENCQAVLTQKDRTEEFWDQISLRDVLLRNEPQAIIKPLPISFAKIFDHPQDNASEDEPVIEHYQASRRFKKMINNNSA